MKSFRLLILIFITVCSSIAHSTQFQRYCSVDSHLLDIFGYVDTKQQVSHGLFLNERPNSNILLTANSDYWYSQPEFYFYSRIFRNFLHRLNYYTSDDAEIDTIPPVIITFTNECGLFDINVTEFNNGDINDIPRQVDKGIKSIEPIFMDNFIFRKDPNVDLESGQLVYEYNASAEVVNIKDTAIAIILVSDHAYNLTLDTIVFKGSISDTIKLFTPDYLSDTEFSPHEKIAFPIHIDIDKLIQYELDSISFRVRYPLQNLKLFDFELGELTQDWDAVVNEVIEDDIYAYVDIQLHSETILQSSGLIIGLNFIALLPHNYELQPQIIVDTTNIIEYCLEIITESVNINVVNCLGPLRSVEIGEGQYYLSNIMPNPVKDIITLNVNLAFKGNVDIEIYNSLGELVKKMFLSDVPKGRTDLFVDVINLAVGTYYLKFRSDAFFINKKFVKTQ